MSPVDRLSALLARLPGIGEKTGLNPFQTDWWEELASLGVVESQSRRWADNVARMQALSAPEPVDPPAGLAAELRHYVERSAQAKALSPGLRAGVAYGPTRAETLDIYPADRPGAPVADVATGCALDPVPTPTRGNPPRPQSRPRCAPMPWWALPWAICSVSCALVSSARRWTTWTQPWP